MKRLTALALSFAALVSDPNPAAAQDLFRAPGAIGLEPTHQSFTGGRYVGEDTAGYIYSAGSGLACHHPSDPSTVYGLDNGGFFDANGGSVGAFSFALLTPDRSAVDVAFVPQYPYWQNTNIESVRIFRVSCAALAPGGLLVLECFTPAQEGRRSGGPKLRELLWSRAIVEEWFAGLEVLELLEGTVLLDEGPRHQGHAEVVRGFLRQP